MKIAATATLTAILTFGSVPTLAEPTPTDAATLIARNSDWNSEPADPREIVRKRASRNGWAKGRQWSCLVELVRRESRWNPDADNPRSSAQGLFQVLRQKPGLSVERQADIGLRYIEARHHTPCQALAFHTERGWY